MKYRSVYRYVDPNRLIDSKTINQDEAMEAGAKAGLEKSVQEVGQIDPILCVMRGREVHIFDGRHRMRRAIKAGEKRIFAKIWENGTPDEFLNSVAANKRFAGRGQGSVDDSIAFFRLNYPHVFDGSDRKFSAEYNGKIYVNRQVYISAVAKVSMKTAAKLLAAGLKAKKTDKVPTRWRSLNQDQEKIMRSIINELKEWKRLEEERIKEAQKAAERNQKILAKIREKAGEIPGGLKRIRKQAGI